MLSAQEANAISSGKRKPEVIERVNEILELIIELASQGKTDLIYNSDEKLDLNVLHMLFELGYTIYGYEGSNQFVYHVLWGNDNLYYSQLIVKRINDMEKLNEEVI